MPQCQFLFSAVFVFQKSYTGNIRGIGQFEDGSFYYYRAEAAYLEGVEEEAQGGHTWPRRGLARA